MLAPVIVLLAMAVGCGEAPPAPAGSFPRMEQGLRRAQEQARVGDAEGARREFYDNAHDPLHRLAADAADRDRVTAARLHEAKQAVEQSLDQRGPTLADDLDRLVGAVRNALGVVGRTGEGTGGAP